MKRLGDEREGRSPLLCFRVPPETMERLRTEAAKQGITVSALARRCVEECIGKSGKKGDAQHG